MTGNPLLDFIVSIAGIAILVILSFFLRQNTEARIASKEQAARRFALDEPDFEADEWVLDQDGKSALAVSMSGDELALIRVHGDKFATRRVKFAQVSPDVHGSQVDIGLDDSTWPNFSLTLSSDALSKGKLSRLIPVKGNSL